jgi:hypothetical protein
MHHRCTNSENARSSAPSAALPKDRGNPSPNSPLACNLNLEEQAHDFGRFSPGAGSIKFHQPSDTFYMLYKGGDRGDGCESDPRQADLYLHCQVQDPYPPPNAYKPDKPQVLGSASCEACGAVVLQ